MKIIKNEKLIVRNGKIGQYASLAGLVLILVPLYFYIPAVIKNDFTNINFTLIVVPTFGGFIASQIGMYMGNRWGRSPRPDEKIDAGLKGLHSEFNMYHYSSPVSHLLVGPSGAWVLIPYHQRGKVSYVKNRWKMSGGGFMQGYMRIFGQESIGRPEADADHEVQTLNKFFAKKLDGTFTPEVKPILVFTSDEVEIDASESPIPAMKLKQLKEFLRQGAKSRILTASRIKEITNLFSES